MMQAHFYGLAAFQELGLMWDAFYPEGDPHADGRERPVLHAQAIVDEHAATGIVVLVEGARYECEVRTIKPVLARSREGGKGTRPLARRAVLLALHRLLQRRTGRALPWGVLFGVRPGKLLPILMRAHTDSGVAASAPGELTEGAIGNTLRTLVDDYAIRRDRAALLVEVAVNERRALPDLYQIGREVSVYVGIPFCPTHCAYCTFPAYSMVDKARYAVPFMSALEREIRAVGEALKACRLAVTTVYVGGGTPTSLMAGELERLLLALTRHLPGAGKWREFSVEAGRADTITPDRVRVMKEAGVNRVSVNPQTFHDATLKRVGRGHSSAIVDKRFALCRAAGFTNINMDLIMGLPGETPDDARYSLLRTLALAPDSVTVHTLSYKRGAAVTRANAADDAPPPDAVAAMLDLAEQELRRGGYQPYYLYRQKDILAGRENIGYARPGKEGLYNIAIIEEAQTIVALGGGGASKWRDPGCGAIARTANAREPSAYVAHIDRIIADKRSRIEVLAKKSGLI